MKHTITFIVILAAMATYGDTYYVSTTGDDGDPGTLSQPWLTWKRGFLALQPGDTLYLRSGVYYSDTITYIDGNTYGSSGTAGSPIVVMGYPSDIAAGNMPILDCRRHCDSLPEPYPGGDIYNSGLYFLEVQYWELRCFEVRNVFQCDSVIDGAVTLTSCANFTNERVNVYRIGTGRGWWYTSGAWNLADSAYAVEVYIPIFGGDPDATSPIFEQPDSTIWINCDVYDVMDTLEDPPGNAADCFKVTTYLGNYIEWNGCRMWHYGDDATDPNNGSARFINTWAMASHKYSNVEGASIERNGIKRKASLETVMRPYWQTYMGYDWYNTYKNDSLSIFNNCLILYSEYGIIHGLSADTGDNPRVYNTTVYGCDRGIQGHDFGLDTISGKWINNLSYGQTLINFTGDSSNVEIFNAPYYETNNSWVYVDDGGYDNFEMNPAFSITANDFITTDSTELVNLFTASRQADGSLPVQRPLMLSPGSDLIDGGTPIGLDYNGSAPDLGYTEYGSGWYFILDGTKCRSCP